MDNIEGSDPSTSGSSPDTPSKKDKRNARVRRLNAKKRYFIWRVKRRLKCKDCGHADPDVLEFDHLDPKTKNMHVGNMPNEGYSIKRIKEEIRKCEVVCANCHRKRTVKARKWYSNHEQFKR